MQIKTVLIVSIPLLFLAFYVVNKVFFIKKTNFIEKKTVNKKKDRNSPEITVKNFCIQEKNKNNKNKWILKSEESKIFSKTNIIECQNGSCTIKENNEKVATLNSKESLLDRNKNLLFLYGPVDGNYKDLKLKGSEINYNFSNQTIETKKKLEYFYPNFRLTAQESFFELKENKIEMENGVKCEIAA